jgi:hypothetical protein
VNTLVLPVNKTLLPKKYITMKPDNIEHMDGSACKSNSNYIILLLLIIAVIAFHVSV